MYTSRAAGGYEISIGQWARFGVHVCCTWVNA